MELLYNSIGHPAVFVVIAALINSGRLFEKFLFS